MIIADRELVETGSDQILDGAQEKDIAFLVVGDPFRYVFLAVHSFGHDKLTIEQCYNTQ